MSFTKVAVIGAGTMGAGIAGQVANAGIEVWLLDLPGKDKPNELAELGLSRIKNPDQPGLMSKEAEGRVHVGNIRDDFHQLADCDWVAEAVVERLDIKKSLYQQLAEVCRDDAIITSNTSTIPIRLLVEDMPTAFRQRFAITHFFNPVRFMPLLELVKGEETSDEVMATLAHFCDELLGKGVVSCLDTPGFLGNRVGVYAIQCALQAAVEMGLSPQQADAIFGRPMGIPKTGCFGLYDLIGIDLMSDVVKSLVNILPPEDAFHKEAPVLPVMARMLENGQRGNKSGAGFYRKQQGGNEVFNLNTEQYEASERMTLPLAEAAERDGVGVLFEDDSLYGQFAWRVLSRTLCYAASLIPEVGEDPQGIDDAMKLGYNWIRGPFELLDDLGVDRFIARLESESRDVPVFLSAARGSSFYRVSQDTLQCRTLTGRWQPVQRAPGIVRFNEKRQTLKPENSCEVASWFDLDGIALVEFHSKANALDGDSMAILAEALDSLEAGKVSGLVVHNDAQHFSCGVNLQAVRRFYEADDLTGLDQFLDHFQRTVHRMSVAEKPVVCAPVGLSLGGGFEVVLHAQRVICHANSVMGLVESGVGVVAAGGGCKETLYRWVEKLGCAEDDIGDASWKAFMNLGYGLTASSPLLARNQAMLRDSDRYLNNRDRLLPAALEAVASSADREPFKRGPLAMPGAPMYQKMVTWLQDKHSEGVLTPHNVVVGSQIARIVTGGDVTPGTRLSEQDLYDAERRAFLELVSTQATRDRISSMLDTGSVVQN